MTEPTVSSPTIPKTSAEVATPLLGGGPKALPEDVRPERRRPGGGTNGSLTAPLWHLTRF